MTNAEESEVSSHTPLLYHNNKWQTNGFPTFMELYMEKTQIHSQSCMRNRSNSGDS
jgi:hypothetical protein